jgi:biotin transport system permease protein
LGLRAQSIFRYKTIKGPLHKLPALLKLFLLLPLSVFCMSLPPKHLIFGIITAVLFAFFCKFSIREQLTDLKPAVFYAALMYALSVFSALWDYFPKMDGPIFVVFTPQTEFIRIALRLFLIIQISALFFRTTSSMEIRDSLRVIFPPAIANNISLFLSFIPEIFTLWSKINAAWKVRGGKNGFNKIKTTVFILISLSMEKANAKSRAMAARGG